MLHHNSQSLPATPKSVNDSNHASSNLSESSAPDAMEDDDHTVPNDDDEQGGDEALEFVLAPTPAQLGRAPLQRRLGSLASMENSKDDGQTTQHMITNVGASMPSGLPTPNSAAIDEAQNPLSPSLKRPMSMFKKHKGEDLNK